MMGADDPTISTLLLDRYRIEGVLGEGGVGSVIKAFDTRLRRTVAIKSLKRSLVTMDEHLLRALEDRFSREAIAGSRMGSHPNLVAVYDLVTGPDETLYLILEYVAGGTLSQRIHADGTLALADALRLTADIARGLQAAHDVGLVHRDVKPANIFIAADGRAQVGDFGIAQIDDLSGRTQTTVGHPGTPLYMSPEQASTTGYLRPTTDQYSLGLVVFEMLTGKAYKRLAPDEIAALLATQPLPIVAMIERLLAENPHDRYPAMSNVLHATQAIASSLEFIQGVETPPDPPPPRDTPPGYSPPYPPVQPLYAQTPPPPAPRAPNERRIGRRAVLVGIGGLVAAGAAGGGYVLFGRDTSRNNSNDSSDTSSTPQGTLAAQAPTIPATQPATPPSVPATVAPTRAPTATATPVPVPTFSAKSVSADFADPNQWNTIAVEYSSRTLADNAYTVKVRKRPDGKGLLSWGDWLPKNVTLAPQFTSEVEMRLAGGPLSVGGILFLFNYVSAAEQQQFLLYTLRADGKFKVSQQLPGGEGAGITRIDWTASGAIRTGPDAPNVLHVTVRNGTLIAGANGQRMVQMPVPAEVATFSAFALAANVITESLQQDATATFRNLHYEAFGG